MGLKNIFHSKINYFSKNKDVTVYLTYFDSIYFLNHRYKNKLIYKVIKNDYYLITTQSLYLEYSHGLYSKVCKSKSAYT